MWAAAFGSKAGLSVEALAVAIAMKVKGRPVKLRLTREEEFYTAFVRQGLIAHFKMGCDEKGRLLAMENRYYWDGGAYTEYGVNVTRAAGYSSTGPYDVPNVKTDSLCVYTNHPVGGPMRGFGMPEMHAGLEQCIDELAHAIGYGPGRVPPAQLRPGRRYPGHRDGDAPYRAERMLDKSGPGDQLGAQGSAQRAA